MAGDRSNQTITSFNNTALFVFTAIALSLGQNFEQPGAGIDPGWEEALVQATDQGLSFGKDLAFTYGPFHQLYINQISEIYIPLQLADWFTDLLGERQQSASYVYQSQLQDGCLQPSWPWARVSAMMLNSMHCSLHFFS